ncbi:glycosyltransferase family 39 protein [Polluticoccus soli]|uniref:glycosyltransferase family 39 protein n=1 Tax=Polluticoccus soli TaxID=3034150 RepID=UPI0023E1A6A4|nr:glycosyltransferase family 39 protein [Flavipsychrobacter sp. JY13-12]
MNRKTLISVVLFLFIILFFSLTYFRWLVYQGPCGVHDWAQADRLSLAISFYDRGMNFFLPATQNLHATDGIVGVEFPLQSYLAAVLGNIFGRSQISILFRLLNTVISCVGLSFLFAACFRATKDFVVSLVPPIFIFCSPVFIYYTCNYLPDTASASVVFVGFYFILKYQYNARVKDMLAAMAVLTLASLIKTSAAIYLLSFMMYVAVQKIFRPSLGRKHNAAFVFSVILSIAVLAGYYQYNQYLNARYEGVLFLAKARPFSGLDEAMAFINGPLKNNLFNEYLTEVQYLVWMAIVAAAVPILVRTMEGKKQLFYLFISAVGALAVAWLMGKQLEAHDYYIIVILLPVIVYSIVISVIAIRSVLVSGDNSFPLKIGTVALLIIMFFFADFRLHQRLKPGYKNGYTGEMPWAIGGDKLLDQLGIPKSEHILVLNELPPNLALVYFDRRGYHLDPGNWSNMGQVAAHMDGFKVDVGVCSEELGRSFLTDTLFKNNFTMLAIEDGKVVFRAKK